MYRMMCVRVFVLAFSIVFPTESIYVANGSANTLSYHSVQTRIYLMLSALKRVKSNLILNF